MAKKKTKGWDEIGKSIGSKIEEENKKNNGFCFNKTWIKHSDGGGFGRLLFIIGVLYALQYSGKLTGMPWWVYVLIVVGFALMRF